MNKAKRLQKLAEQSNVNKPEGRSDIPNINSFVGLVNVLKIHKIKILILFLVTSLAYGNSLFGEFLSDDLTAIVGYKDLSNIGLQVQTLYIQKIIQSLILNIFGLNTFPFHLLSVLLHIFAVISFFALLTLLFTPQIAFYSSLIFALYPVNVESVSWISGVNYIYMAIVLYLTAIFYLLYKKSSKSKYLYVSLSVWILSLITFRSPWLISFPFILVLLSFFEARKVHFDKVFTLYFVPLIALAFSLYHDYATRVTVLQSLGAGESQQGTYFLRILNSYYKFLELLLFPFFLTLYHEGEQISFSYQLFMYALCAFSIALILYFVKKKNFYSVFYLISLVSLAPLFSPVQVAWVATERYLYIASSFFALMIVLFVQYLTKKYKKELLVWVLILICTVFGIRVLIRNMDWLNFKNFAISNSSASPYSPQALNALGDYYFGVGEFEKSREALEKSVQLYPEFAIAVHNLGRTYYSLERLNDAEVSFKRAIELNPNMYQSLTGLGIIELRKGNKEEALKYADLALKIEPDNQTALKLWSLLSESN